MRCEATHQTGRLPKLTRAMPSMPGFIQSCTSLSSASVMYTVLPATGFATGWTRVSLERGDSSGRAFANVPTRPALRSAARAGASRHRWSIRRARRSRTWVCRGPWFRRHVSGDRPRGSGRRRARRLAASIWRSTSEFRAGEFLLGAGEPASTPPAFADGSVLA